MSSALWAEVAAAAHAQILRAATATPGVLAIAVHAFYGDGTVLYWPSVAVATAADLAAGDTEYERWNPADWAHDWDPTDGEDAVAQRVADVAAAAGDEDFWHRTYERFIEVFIEACAAVRGSGQIPEDVLVIVADEGWEALPRTLSPAQLSEHFPDLEAQLAAESAVRALEPRERVAALIEALGGGDPVVELYRASAELIAGEHPGHERWRERADLFRTDLEPAIAGLSAHQIHALLRRRLRPGVPYLSHEKVAELLLELGPVARHALEDARARLPRGDQAWRWQRLAAALARTDHP